uniref:DNA-directed DNA polymerase n=1 Tax=viral metagenome TaxID=1070528 RepID=A0A6C0BLG1_9ZZZZ
MTLKRPSNPFKLDNNENDLVIQLIDYYRCIDTIDSVYDDDGNNDDDDDDGSDENLYSKEKQRELSKKYPMLIKAFGILETGQSITLNLRGFEPFFYIKIPNDWEVSQCRLLVNYLCNQVYYQYKTHLLRTQIVLRKPFTEFTGDDKFKFLKLQFKNKESYDQYSYKLANPITVPGLNQNKPHKYDLFESNIEPMIKLIHMTKINPCGWIKLPSCSYQIVQRENLRTTTTEFEINVHWDQIQPYEKLESAAINVMAFDIEADSSHGDFPVAIKNYQKLSQELVTLFNSCGIQCKKTRIHPLFQQAPQQVIRTLLHLIFDDNFQGNNIHQIRTQDNIKPNPETVHQLAVAISQLYQHKLGTDDVSNLVSQVTDLCEFNLPSLDLHQEHNSHYGLLAEEIVAQMTRLTRNNNRRFQEVPIEVVTNMFQLAFNDHFDGFMVSNVFTKNHQKPSNLVLDALVPDVYKYLLECAEYVHMKHVPEHLSSEDRANLSQDYFVTHLTQLFDQYLPPLEGDQLIQIGSTFQLTNQPDCYLKYMICLKSCNSISNTEMITFENKDIYLPVDELASDLVHYERFLASPTGATVPVMEAKQLETAIKDKVKEIKPWTPSYRKEQCQKAAEYRRLRQSETDHARVVVEYYDDERQLLLAWKRLIIANDPDLVLGYNVFGFDFKFLYERAQELGCADEFCQLGRLKNCTEAFHEQKLSSAGLGDNTLRYVPMAGRVMIDLYKVIQKDYRLDSYKLDNVSHKFLYKEKVDMPPREIFSLQKGTAEDRKKIGIYCLIDCILCNRLALKLEIINNNLAMAKVCKVPLSYLFLRGQGVKIFSLVSDVCSREGYLVPVLPKANPDDDSWYEGAIVLTPDTKIHFKPIVVGDFNSLYPSSMISENISHDSFVTIGGQYDNLPGYTYNNIEYDIYKTDAAPGTKKKRKVKTGVQVCRYAQLPGGKKSILPTILMELLAARKNAKKKMEDEKNPFKQKLWNGLQLAYKVTANSLYGQCGAKTSPINKVEIAASTTAVGRRMITFSRSYIEREYKDKLVTLDLECSGIFDSEKKHLVPTKYTGRTIHVKNSYCVYGDTDSVFICFNVYAPSPDGNGKGPVLLEKETEITGLEAVSVCIALCKKAVKEISAQLKRPQNIEFEKAIYPFILISKKRYHGHYYTKIDNPSFYPNSMGIALKRRDNAPIVKHIFGGAIDIIMNEKDVDKAREYVINECRRLLKGEFPLSDFVISKTLRSYYKKPQQIAHNVLACRQAQRDPGNRFEPNDRVPYAYIATPGMKDALQGDRIETPEFIQQNKLTLDYRMYITNQIMKPVSQIFELVPGYENIQEVFNRMLDDYENERDGVQKLDQFLKTNATVTSKLMFTKFSDLVAQARAKRKLGDQSPVIPAAPMLPTSEDDGIEEDDERPMAGPWGDDIGDDEDDDEDIGDDADDGVDL